MPWGVCSFRQQAKHPENEFWYVGCLAAPYKAAEDGKEEDEEEEEGKRGLRIGQGQEQTAMMKQGQTGAMPSTGKKKKGEWRLLRWVCPPGWCLPLFGQKITDYRTYMSRKKQIYKLSLSLSLDFFSFILCLSTVTLTVFVTSWVTPTMTLCSSRMWGPQLSSPSLTEKTKTHVTLPLFDF